MTTRDQAIAAMRLAADLTEQHPDLPLPTLVPEYGYILWTLYSWEHEDLAATATLIRRTVGGEWKKSYDTTNLVLTRTTEDGVEFSITVKRDAVCTRRVVGTETVTVPAVEAQPERVEEREVVEWDCHPILADADTAAVA